MSFESVPCAETDISVEPLTPGYFLAFAARTIQDLNWTITFCDDHSLNATTASPDRPSCEEFIISVEGTTAHLRSQSFGNQLQQFDFGRNNENIREFLVRFEERDKALVPEQLAEEYEQLKTKLRPAEDDEDTEQEMQPEPVKASVFVFPACEGIFCYTHHYQYQHCCFYPHGCIRCQYSVSDGERYTCMGR